MVVEAATTMSPEARIIPVGHIDARRIESFMYPTADILPGVEELLPPVDTEQPLGALYMETSEEKQKRVETVEQEILRKRAEADRVIDEKQAKADLLVSEAEQKLREAEGNAAEIRQKAYEEGFSQGESEGHQSAEERFKEHLLRLEESLEAISDAVSLYKAASEDEVLALITVMAEYLAAQRLATSADAAGSLLRSILEAHPLPLPESAAPGEPAVVVFMHPRDLEQTLDGIKGGQTGLRLLPDNALSRGSLRLETADTVIEASFEKRRERLLLLVNRLKEEGRI